MSEWLLIKKGMYYRPGSMGYTGIRDEAGRFSDHESREAMENSHDGSVTRVLLSEAQEFSEDCWHELALNHLRKKIAALTERNEVLEKVIGLSNTGVSRNLGMKATDHLEAIDLLKLKKPDGPLRHALKETIIGLRVQIPPSSLEGPTSPDHLKWMLDRCLVEIETMPVDKISRWIGFVQGCLATSLHGFSIEEERDRTRPLFHAAYKAMGIPIPETKR